MAVSSISATLIPSLPLSNSSPFPSSKAKLTSFSLPASHNVTKLPALRPSLLSSTRVYAAPEVLDSPVPPPEILEGPNSDEITPKQKIRIKLRSYFVPLIEDSCKQIMDAARNTNAKTMGPVPLPTKKRIYCVLKSPHVHKDARFHFEIRTHQRLIDILYPTAQTIDSLMQLDLPAGVDVEVKL
ncbi:30S ribosomal protein S10, chloroplastic isoform X2 [Rosa chinensis]|uniref:30S ribosomal protein S10, chloroplastic isoform X2 n=1 Tax=Rosa chinensis TaxID=74649 RepID=UPI001AD8A2F7|nr:30S ribosomal protein S10, chloroplastic isoform X2 [Rosa chinensis]